MQKFPNIPMNHKVGVVMLVITLYKVLNPDEVGVNVEKKR